MKSLLKRKKEYFKKILRELKNLINLKTEFNIAGWSSLVARQAHNLKVGGSNPSPATKYYNLKSDFLLSTKKAFTVSTVSDVKVLPNFSILSIMLGGAVIIWQPKLFAWV